ncbi:MAG: hypothetical protein ACK2UY_12665 [Anaerolineae bacterium]|jgi:predicted PurR-regulated permease PerM
MEVWRDISLMWLILLTFVAVLPFGVIFYLAVRGMRRLRQVLKKYFPLAQDKVSQVADKTEEISDKVAQPVVELYAKAAQVNTMARTILRRNEP